MIFEVSPAVLSQIRNPYLAEHCSIYVGIQQDFYDSISAFGLEIAPYDDCTETRARITQLASSGATLRNNNRSIVVNHISPACTACQTGLGSATFFVSLKCHRKCFYCFNPNQENYAAFQLNSRNCAAELDKIFTSGARLNHIALTGGEPLLHRREAVEFFRHANLKFPYAYKRLYTSGDHLNVELLTEFKREHLDEIRFSIRMHDSDKAQQRIFDRIALAKSYIPNVMVEMPVLPGTLDQMKQILLRLNKLGVSGINLLEFCFPFNNAQVYREKGYRIKHRPFRVLYDYSYAGGLPVARSESDCLDLLEFAIEQNLSLGVHYCSLENKLTGEFFQRHYNREIPAHLHLSQKDYLLKSAKVFGEDIPKVLPVFERMGYSDFIRDEDRFSIEFHVNMIERLRDMDIEIGISTSVIESRPEGEVFRELQIELTTPGVFDLATDV